MKATGIVRRIDDLGRVVIPKEIRRTMRIREGDPLEIYTEKDGEVIFKKYSPIGEMVDFASQIAESITNHSTFPVIILDRDHCIASSGISKREVIERRLTQDAEEYMENRTKYIYSENTNSDFFPLEGVDRKSAVFIPIISAGDISGAVVMLQDNAKKYPTESDEKICSIAASFLGKQMEE